MIELVTTALAGEDIPIAYSDDSLHAADYLLVAVESTSRVPYTVRQQWEVARISVLVALRGRREVELETEATRIQQLLVALPEYVHNSATRVRVADGIQVEVSLRRPVDDA